MNDLDAREQRLLAGARRALSPQSSDQQRLLAALTTTLTLPESAPRPAGHGSSLIRYALGVSAIGVAVLAGYGWGYRAGEKAHQAPAVVAGPAPQIALAPPPLAVSIGVPNAQPTLPEPQAHARQERPRGSRLPTAPAVAVPAATTTTAPGLDEEVRELRRIERALRDSNPRLALVIAENLERSVPQGQLLVERRAASLMANCQLGADDAERLAARFLDENPDSAYAARLREVCKLGTTPQRTSPAAGTEELRKAGER